MSFHKVSSRRVELSFVGIPNLSSAKQTSLSLPEALANGYNNKSRCTLELFKYSSETGFQVFVNLGRDCGRRDFMLISMIKKVASIKKNNFTED